MNKFYVTTPIYYASGKIHIGHAYCSILADTMARYKKLCGYDVFFLTGSDEHGQKIAERANDSKMTPQAYVDMISDNFKENWKALYIDYDKFIRTTDKEHVECVQKVFEILLKQGDIYKSSYDGWYCTPCESFWTDHQIGEDHLCPDCHREVHRDKEECYFFNVKKYIPQLLKFYKEHPDFIPGGKFDEMYNNFIKPKEGVSLDDICNIKDINKISDYCGIEDLCVSRTTFDWGIPVKSDPKHVVYVWIDALLNYISALGYQSEYDSNFKKLWSEGTEILHFAGKDINRFHTIYWPIILFALNLRLPDTVFIHGLLITRSGVKMSKSLGNAPSPYPLIERYSVDALRYYYVAELQMGEDGLFTPNQFVDRINADLVNNYGNLVNRSLGMVSKYRSGIIPSHKPLIKKETIIANEKINEHIQNYFNYFDSYNITKAMAEVCAIGNVINKYIDETAPWILAKEEDKALELDEVLFTSCDAVRLMSIMFRPSLVLKADQALDSLNVSKDDRNREHIKLSNYLDGKKINISEPLFPRLKRDEEIEFLVNLIDIK